MIETVGTPPADTAARVHSSGRREEAKRAPKGDGAGGSVQKTERDEGAAEDVNNAVHESQKAARKLSEAFSESGVRFVVLDPTSTSPHNVVIEMLKGDEVVARIPSESAREVVAPGSDLKGAAVDFHS